MSIILVFEKQLKSMKVLEFVVFQLLVWTLIVYIINHTNVILYHIQYVKYKSTEI